MSSSSISPTDSFKRPFRPDQGPVQKKQKVSSNPEAEVITCLADTICKLGETFFSEDDNKFGSRLKAIEAGDSDHCKFMKTDLSDVFGVSDDVDTLYTEVLKRLKETSTSKPEEIKAKASENIPSDSVAVIKKLAKIVSKWVDHFTSDGYDSSSRVVIRILTESSKLNSKLDKLRESHLAASLEYSENIEPFSSDLDPDSWRFIIRELKERSKLDPELDKLREWNINKCLGYTDEVEFN